MASQTRGTRRWFVLTGVLVGSFAVSAADIEVASGLDRDVFGAVMAVGLLCGAAANVIAGRQCARVGLPVVARRWGVAWALALAVAASFGATPLVAAAVVVVWATTAGVDITMNISATTALGGRPGRLLVFNTWFNGGAVLGALSTAVAASLGGSWRVVWASVAVLALWAASRSLDTAPPVLSARSASADDRPVPHARVIGSVVLLAAGLFGSGAVGAGLDVWGVAYLRQDLGASLAGGALAVVAGQSVAIVARLGAGLVAAGSGVRTALAATGFAVLAGVVLLTSAGTAPIAALGLAMTMGVLSCAWPLTLLQVASVSAQPARALGVVSAAGQIGRVIGPFAVAAVAQRTDLVAGLRVLLVGGAVMLAGAILSPAETDRREKENTSVHSMSPPDAPKP